MCKFGQGISNSNGEYLLEYVMQNDLVQRTPYFHTMAYRTNWTSQERVEDHLPYDGT